MKSEVLQYVRNIKDDKPLVFQEKIYRGKDGQFKKYPIQFSLDDFMSMVFAVCLLALAYMGGIWTMMIRK